MTIEACNPIGMRYDGDMSEMWQPVGAEGAVVMAGDAEAPPSPTLSARLVLMGVFAARGLGFAVRAALDVLVPPTCASCHGPVAADGGVCGSCFAHISWIEAPVCARLGLPFAYDIGPGALSARAIAEPPPFERARSAAVYAGRARELVHAFKFGDRPELAALLAGPMVRAGHELVGAVDVVVPVPLDRWRLLGRRYNQASLLAAAVARRIGRPHEPMVLKRLRRTRSQVGLSGPARADNVRGVFALEPRLKARVAGKRVLLIDDVITTGATVAAATRALKRGGAASVDVLSFARVVPGLGDPI